MPGTTICLKEYGVVLFVKERTRKIGHTFSLRGRTFGRRHGGDGGGVGEVVAVVVALPVGTR
jgi:hypothetical protein